MSHEYDDGSLEAERAREDMARAAILPVRRDHFRKARLAGQVRRVVAAGTRNGIAYADMHRTLDAGLRLWGLRAEDVEIISGACPGEFSADAHAMSWAKNFAVPAHQEPADWSQGRSAGPRRNGKLAAWAAEGPTGGFLAVAWDGKSRGSMSMMKEAAGRGLHIHIGLVGRLTAEVAVGLVKLMTLWREPDTTDKGPRTSVPLSIEVYET